MLKSIKYNSKIPSDIIYIEPTVNDVVFFLQKAFGNISESIIFELKVMLNDLLINAIKHGNQCNYKKTVKINAGIAKNRQAYILIEDEGAGYNYKEVIEKSKCLCDLLENGRGILIVSSLCDKICLNKKGNKVLVFKKIY